MSHRTVIIGGARTPFGTLGGGLRDIPATRLGATAIRAALERTGTPVDKVDQVIMGMVIQAGAGQIPSRQASLGAGLPQHVPSETINKVCASGLRAVNWADVLIRCKEAAVVVAGGMENMSQGPYLVPGARWGYRFGSGRLVDATQHDGLWCAFGDVAMGNYGDNAAREYGISRADQDAWAYRSHQRALAAIDSGRFADEIVPVAIPQRKGDPVPFETDEAPRRDTSLEKLARLRPAFDGEGTVTAGNAPGINDGAAALVLASETAAQELGIRPLARIVSWGTASAKPGDLHTVPALAAQAALKKAGLKPGDMDLVEINEAFAAVTLTSLRMAGWDEDIVNVNGGAIALGHPIGASGARILLTLVMELARRGGRYGLAAICSGGGQGEATIVEAGRDIY